jgi:PAS domain S-box-containing protein
MDRVYKIVFNTIQEGLILTDMTGRIRLLNPRAEELFGYSGEELLGQQIEVLIPQELRSKHITKRETYEKRPVNRQMGSGMTLFGLRKNGSKFPLEISLNTFEDDEGSRFVTALITDISIRKKAQDEVLRINDNLERIVSERTKELYESNVLLASVSKYFPNGSIYILDIDFKISYADGKELEREKIDGSDLVNQDYIEYNQQNRRTLHRMLNDLINFGEVPQIEIERNGEYYSVDAILIRDSYGVLSRILIVENNITALKKTAEALKKNYEEQQKLNELKSRFVSFASHEFRTPLTTMNSSADLIGRYVDLGDCEKIKKHVQRIQGSIQYMTNLLNDYLSLDKIDSGLIQANIQKIELNKFVENCLEGVSGQKKPGQETVFYYDCEALYSDPNLLSAVMINLISNAFKYSPENSKVEVSFMKSENQCQIEVKDQGLGIPEQEQVNLFSRFFRGSNAAHIEGTGLGLHIVARHIAILKGSITCESQEGKGSTFIIKLPQNH